MNNFFKYVKLDNRLNIKQKNEYLIHITSSERAFEDTAVNHTLPSLHERHLELRLLFL